MQRFPRVVAGVVAFALLVAGLEAQQAQAGPVAEPPPVAKVASRPDVISAAVTARSQGSKVEVESMRTETATTWANPDGTMTTEAHLAPVRFKNAAGQWRSVNLELAKSADGAVAPRGHKLGLRLGKRSSASGGVFASAAAGSGRQVEWLAPWKLPEPTIEKTKATYAEIQPGVDLTLDARRNGFETDFVVKSRPTAAPVWKFPLRTKGLTVRTAKSGVIEFVDPRGVVQGRIPVAYMWDAAKDQVTGEPANKAVVNVTVEQVSAGKATLVVAPDKAWFMDPEREFPVTVDPTYVSGSALPSFDTFVQTSFPSDLSATTDLRVGKNGTHQERTFFNFGTGPFQGRDIVDAYLSLYQDGATTCTPTAVTLHGAGVASTATRWDNQPTITPTASGTASFAKGFSSSCAAGRVGIPMTSLAQYWSTTQAGTVGVALKAGNESDPAHWKRFRSMESSTDPFVSFTWNRKPNAPATVEPRDAVAYAAPGETTSSLYSATLRPYVQTKATDADANTVKYVFEFYTGSGSTLSVKGTCTSPVVASGTTAGCAPTTDLPDNTLLFIRAKANDGRLDGPWVGFNQRLRTGAVVPALPVVSCPAPYGNNTWQDAAPTADVKCTISATGVGYNAPGYLRVIIDGTRPPSNPAGGAEGRIKIVPSSDPAVSKWDVTFPKDKVGLHTIVAQAETPAGRMSTTSLHYKFGWGGTSLTAPTADSRIATADNIRVTASGPPKGTASYVEARVKWRVSGYGGNDDTVGWNEDASLLPVTDNGAGGVTVNTLWDTNNAKIDAHLDSNPDQEGIQPTTLNDRVPVKLDVQVCFKYGGAEQCTWSQTPDTTIQRVPHAFGNGYPTSEAGPGQVALWTGEFNLSASDISVPGYSGDLSISRSHMTIQSPNNAVTGVFGEEWTAQFDGADAGAAGLQVIDSTRLDGTLVLVDDDGSTLIYESPTGDRRTKADLDQGTWVPADTDTTTAASKLKVSGTGANAVVSYIEDDGTITTWTSPTAPSAATDKTFRAEGISEPGVAGKTTFSYDSGGRPTRILAPAAPGVTCGAYVPGTPLSGMNPGCRALHFDYTAIDGSKWRMSGAWLDIYNPDKTGTNKMDSIKVAAYTYDANGRLLKVTDPRSNLSTEYTYNAAADIATVKPAGQIPFQLNYVSVGDRPKLDTVTRERPAGDPTGGTATLGKYIYDVSLSGDGLPDLSAGSVARWNQKSAPVRGVAVFGPDHAVSGVPGSADWQYADLQYVDAAGYTVNTAKYGAGDWQYTSTDYDDQGNTIRELDERALRTVLDGNLDAGATVDQLATVTVYNPEIKNAAGDTVLTPAGTLVTDTYGPTRYAALKNGTIAFVRPHKHTTYDEGAPNSGINPDTSLPYRLATKETSYAHDPGTGTDLELTSQSLTDYGASVTGDADGWARSLPGKTINDVDLDGTSSSADIVNLIRYDAEGKIFETRQPASNGADAGTRKTVYYTTAANSSFAGCGGKPEWAGLVCTTYPAAQPTQASGGSTPTLPSMTTIGFTYLLAPKTTVETSGPVTRTTTTSYLLDGRALSSKTTVAGLPGSAPNTEKVTAYDSATGQPTVVTAKNLDGSTAGTITTGYDTWGRQTTYQPSGDAVTTTVYDAAGSVATVTDANGSTTYTYDGTDANNKQERRGVPTRIEVTTAGTTWTSTGAYDANGSMTIQKLPGGIARHHDIDSAGEPTSLRYTGPVTVTNADGTSSTDPNGPWLSWSLENDTAGRITHEWTPDGAAFTTAAGGALPYDRRYSYDQAGRLTTVNDRTATAPGVDVTDPAEAPACVTRTYGFDRNDNRLSKATAPAAADGSCATAGATVVTRAFDTADRPVSGAGGAGTYSYDPLGRTTTLPAADAPRPAEGDITLAYYDNDLARSITQNGSTTTFTLDAADRRGTETVTAGSATTSTVRHYTDASDNPTWVSQGTTTQRYAELIGDDLSLSIDKTGAADLAIANPHGDVVTTINLDTPAATADSITGWNNYDEYGNATNATQSAGPVNYGWLGAKQRATSSSGLLLMGVRLYSPSTGLFTSVDPVVGGNANAYNYPSDPINSFDLDGRWGWLKRRWESARSTASSAWGGVKRGARSAWNASGRASRWLTGDSKWAKRIRNGCKFTWGAVGAVCSGVYTAAYLRAGGKNGWKNAVGEALGFAIGGGTAKLAMGGFKRAWRHSSRNSRGRWKVRGWHHRSNKGARRAFHYVSEATGLSVQQVGGYYYNRRMGID
ncbi:RHS repeat-associated core domain-containing protein [Kribbella sandramycini]|uniref:RHS repeat-associated protein n=1 Tax=Kribbella sandramycini TaxID=60450 RepID=A0A841SDH6_9ACTN|nr:RHS repeat-associated protein [Kribbella sandramycini]